ncbi:MAG: hypothetical protein M3069_19035 [Chloroflexota bacterium]|nr:hypothetical protein [Chloroflexota bacterium]
MLVRWVGAGIAALVVWSTAGALYAHDSGLGIVRYNPDGSLDAGFGRGGVVAERTPQGGLSPEALVIQADGKAVLGGTASDLATAAVGFGLARYNADGSLDSGFGAGGRVLTRVGAATAEAHALALQADGTILVAGSAFGSDAGSVSNFAVARYAPDGSLDRGFGAGAGAVLTPIAPSGAEARAVVLQSDGRIVVGGTTFATGSMNDGLALARYNLDGSLDSGFGSGGSVITTFDTSGAEPGSSPFRMAALVVQPDGKLVAIGSIGGHQGAFALARYLPNGDLDAAFGSRGMAITRRDASTQAYAAAAQPDGKIVVGGGVGAANENLAFGVARYAPSGDLDPSFGSGGFVMTAFPGGGSGAHAVSVAADGAVVAAGSGYVSTVPPQQTGSGQGPVNGGFAVARYLPNGAPEAGFGKRGVVVTTVGDAGSTPAAVAIQPDGKLVVAGLTYFLVPTPTEDRISFNVLLILAVVGLLLLLLGAVVFRLWRRHSARSAGSRIGATPGVWRSRQ